MVLNYHAAAGFPTKPSWIAAINNKHYTSWPGLDTRCNGRGKILPRVRQDVEATQMQDQIWATINEETSRNRNFQKKYQSKQKKRKSSICQTV